MRMVNTLGRVSVALLVIAASRSASAQACYTKTTNGSAATATLVSALEAVGTSQSNVDARENNGLDSSSYLLQTFTGPSSITIATALVSGPVADNDRAPFGLTFINGGATDVHVTAVRVTTTQPIFRTSPAPTNIDPATGSWATAADHFSVTWTAPAGGYVVAAKSAQGFIVRVAMLNSANGGAPINGVVVGGTITTTELGVLTASGFPTDVYAQDSSNKVGEGVIAFVDPALPLANASNYPRTISNATYGPPSNLIGGQVSTIRIRAQEYANNQSIAAGLKLTVTIPAGWTYNSASGTGWTFDTTNLPASVTATYGPAINKGNAAPDIALIVTPPVVYTKSTYQMVLSLDGKDTSAGPAGQHPIRSVCDGGGTILPVQGGGPAPTLNVEFLSPRLNVSSTSAPVASLDLTTSYDLRNHSGTIQVSFDRYNFTTSSWQTVTTTSFTTSTPQTTATVTISGTALNDYLDSQGRMRIRYVTNTGGPQTLRIDQLGWTASLSWAVDSVAGNDNWSGVKFPGSLQNPFQTLAKVATVLTGSEQVQVLGRATSYSGNIGVAAAGTATCKTLYQGVPITGVSPKIHGASAASDVAFQVTASHVKVDGFGIDNMLVGLDVEGAVTGTIFSNNNITVADGAYGVLVYQAIGSSVFNNTLTAASNASPFSGIFDWQAQSTTIDTNKISGIAFSDGITIESSAAPTIQRNIVTGNYFGIHIARTTGVTNLYNNTSDSNFYAGVFSESGNGGTITSRNNIISRNNRGWQADAPGYVNSNYDDVWANTNFAYVNVSQGANSIAANPAWIQTNNAALATYFKLNTGSPCINTGTTLPGLTYIGAADIGAVESQ